MKKKLQVEWLDAHDVLLAVIPIADKNYTGGRKQQ
jgi:hypothetical protein